ncbi:MAG: hypothetical protein ABL925_10140, partial [Methylococcales bacterium]
MMSLLFAVSPTLLKHIRKLEVCQTTQMLNKISAIITAIFLVPALVTGRKIIERQKFDVEQQQLESELKQLQSKMPQYAESTEKLNRLKSDFQLTQDGDVAWAKAYTDLAKNLTSMQFGAD